MISENKNGHDAHNKKIQNVADGIVDTDVVNVRQLNAKVSGTVKAGRFLFDAANGAVQEIPHGLDATPTSCVISLENGVTVNQDYTYSVDSVNITLTFADAIAFESTYVNWIVVS